MLDNRFYCNLAFCCLLIVVNSKMAARMFLTTWGGTRARCMSRCILGTPTLNTTGQEHFYTFLLCTHEENTHIYT